MVLLGLTVIALPGPAPAGPSGNKVAHATPGLLKPNLLFVLTDDQPVKSMAVMPRTREGFPVSFTNAFVTTPLCCPSRASILTGRYAHATGVRGNGDYPTFKARWEADSLGPWLDAQGYYTGFVGKYLNRFRENPVPPGWDEFYALVSGDYHAFRMREARRTGPDPHDGFVSYPNDETPQAYATTVMGDKALSFLERAASPVYNTGGQPWALFLWLQAPHTPLSPVPPHDQAAVPRRSRIPSFMERDLSDKPREVRRYRKLRRRAKTVKRIRRGQLRMLMSVDDTVERVFDTLDELSMRDQTWGLFTSDNGFLWGEHRLTGKRFAYEESIRVPFRFAIPGREPETIPAMVANIDIAPTFAELAGDPGDHGFDGVSLLPLIEGQVRTIRSRLVIEAAKKGGYDAFRTRRWTFIRWRHTRHMELYDLKKDRYQLRNIAKTRPRVVRRLKRGLRAQLGGEWPW
ncbi:MAG TPA: sulfatase [Actinomycetota bacterium]